jgi:hypothetical protein
MASRQKDEFRGLLDATINFSIPTCILKFSYTSYIPLHNFTATWLQYCSILLYLLLN